MDNSSLPRFPATATEKGCQDSYDTDPGLSSRTLKNLRNLSLICAFILMLVALRRTSAAIERSRIPPPPRQISLTKEIVDKVQFHMTRAEVERLLGPPTESHVVDPRFDGIEESLEWSNRHLGLPRNSRIWRKWVDSDDNSKSITILFADGKVYYWLKSKSLSNSFHSFHEN